MKIDLSHIRSESWLIFLAGTLIFSVFLKPELINFQTRFALFAQNMFHTGITFFPTTYMGPYPDYPATSTMMIYWFSLLFGKVTPFTAIFPTAMTASLILVMTYKIGALQSKQWGFLAVGFLLLTQFFVQESRSISPDQYISLITTCCFYLAYSASLHNTNKPLFYIPFLFALGFAFRGPIGLIIPSGVIVGYYLVNRDWGRLLLFGFISAILLTLLSLALLAAARYQGGDLFLQQVISLQVISRMQGNHGFFSYLYYWVNGLGIYALSFPLAFLVMIARFKAIWKPQTQQDQLLLSLAAWVLIILIGLSIPGGKKIRYIFSIVPALSLIASYIFIAKEPNKLLRIVKIILVKSLAIFPYLLLVTIPIAYLLLQKYQLPISTDLIISMICLLLLIGLSLFLKYHPPFSQNARLIFIAILSLIVLNIFVLEPISYLSEKTAPFISQFQRLKPRPVVFYKIGPDAEDIKFMVALDKPIKLVFIQSYDKLMKYREKAYFISETKDFINTQKQSGYRLKLIFKSKIGHRPCTVFEK